jgi:hypothetical protein
VSAIGRPNRPLLEQLAEQRDCVLGGDRQLRRGLRCSELSHELRGHAPVEPAPNGVAAKRRRGFAEHRTEARKRQSLAEHAVERRDRIAHRAPRAHGALLREPCVEAAKSCRWARPAQCAIQSPDMPQPFRPRLALAAEERVLEERKQRHGREIFRIGRGDCEEQGPRCDLRQGAASAVVRLDFPAAKQRGYPAGELAIRGDERGGLARRLERLPKSERDRLSLRRRIGKFGQANAAQAPFGSAQCLPLVREIGR